MIKTETRHISDEIFPEKGFDCKYFVNDDGRDISCDYIKSKYGKATEENAQKFFDEQAKNNEIEKKIRRDEALVKNTAFEIYFKISNIVLNNLVHFTNDCSGFNVHAYPHSGTDGYHITLSQIEGDEMGTILMIDIENEEITKKIIHFLESNLPCNLVEFKKDYRD